MQSTACVWLVALVVTSLLAGCATSSPEGESPAEGIALADPSSTAPWTSAQVDGEFTTTMHANPEGLTDRNAFQVPPGLAELWLNITVVGTLPGDVDVRYVKPDCPEFECTQQTPAKGGQLATFMTNPEGGEWSLVFFAQGGVQTGSYSLSLAMR